MMRHFIVLPLLVALPVALCAPAHAAGPTLLAGATTAGDAARRVSGSGHEVDEVRPLPSFVAVRVNGPIDVVLRPGEREQATVRFDDNLQTLVETKVTGVSQPTLEIQLAPGASFRSGNGPRVTVEFRNLNALTVRGSGDVTASAVRTPVLAVSMAGSGDVHIEQLEAETLGVAIAGSGDFRASGRAKEQGFRIAGSGDVNAGSLIGQVVKVSIAGSGDARVHAEQSLEATVAGSGDVIFSGTPVVRKTVAGSGEVRRAN